MFQILKTGNENALIHCAALGCCHWSAASKLSTPLASLVCEHTHTHIHIHTHTYTYTHTHARTHPLPQHPLYSVIHWSLSLLIQWVCASEHWCTFAIWWIPDGWQETLHFKAATSPSLEFQPARASLLFKGATQLHGTLLSWTMKSHTGAATVLLTVALCLSKNVSALSSCCISVLYVCVCTYVLC